MSSNPCDIEKPATESDIAEAISVSDPDTADTVLRLAYQRDSLQDRLRAASGGCRILSEGDGCTCGLCARDRLIHTLETALRLAAGNLSWHSADDHPNDIYDQLMAEAKEPNDAP